MYVCDCGNEIDRDLNAAINLEQYGTASSAGSYAYGESGSGSTFRLSETGLVEVGNEQEVWVS